MLTIQWTVADGWAAPEIRPYAPFVMDPAAMVLHHALCLFEVSVRELVQQARDR